MRRSLPALLLLLCAVPVEPAEISAWLPTWDERGFETLLAQSDQIDEINPVWYVMKSDGGIETKWNAENPSWVAAMSGMRIVPTIQNTGSSGFDVTLVESVLLDDAKRTRHVDAIVDLVVTRAWDGIDIDYERIPSTARAEFTELVSELATELHRNGKVLSVTVHPKTSDAPDWKGPGGQDWPAIGAHADTVKIMAYDFHWSTSEAGPIAPLGWLADVARYARETIPARKIVMALPWYGYDWQGKQGEGVTWSDATQRSTDQLARVSRTRDGELTFGYGDHVVYFQDAESYRQKTAVILAEVPDIGGFSQWRLGGEDPASWEVVRSLRETTATEETATKTRGRRRSVGGGR